MKKINFTYKGLYLAMAFAITSCSEAVISDDAGKAESKGGNILVSATVVPPIEDLSALNSRVLSGENENHISNLHVLAFNKAGEMIANGFSDFSMDGQKEFTLNLGVDKADQKVTLFAIANIDNTLIFNSHDMNLETFSHLYVKAENANSLESGTYSIYKSNGEKFCDIINQSSPILISEGTTITVEKDGTTTAQLNLVRQCAKVTLTVHPNDVNIYAYQLRHIPTISYLKNNQENYSDPEFSDVPVKFVEDGENVTDVTFYIYENYNDAVLDITAQKQRNPSKAPADASYINIWGKYNSIEGDEMSTMYRVYLGGVDDEGHQDLKQFTLRRNQNYVYDVTLRQNGTADPRCITGKLKPNYGDFLFSDGSWGPYVKATEKRYPVAIIYRNETTEQDQSEGYMHGYAFALKDASSSCTWYDAFDICKNYSEPVPMGAKEWFFADEKDWFDLFVNVGGVTGTYNSAKVDAKAMDNNDVATFLKNINAKMQGISDDYCEKYGTDYYIYWNATEANSTSNAYRTLIGSGYLQYGNWTAKSYSNRARSAIVF